MAALEPVVEAGGEGAAGLLAFGLGLIFWVLATGWNQTLGAGLRSIAREIEGVRLPHVLGHGRFLGPVADAFYAADSAVHRALVAVANENFHAGRWFFNASARSWTDLATTLAHVAVAVERSFAHFEEVILPRWVGHALAHTGAFAVWLLTEARHEGQAVRDWTREQVHRRTVAVGHEFDILGRRVGRVGSRVGRLERDAAGLRARLRGLEGKLAAGAFAGLVVAALGRLGLRWLRCGNVNKVGRSVCGMNPSLLESLLADALLVGGAISLVALAEHMQGVVGESAGLIQRFWR